MTESWTLLALGASTLVGGCGSSAAGERAPHQDQRLNPDPEGWVDRSLTGTTRIQGQWRGWQPFNELPSNVGIEPGVCPPTAAYGDCSIVIEPAADRPYSPTAGLGMCASGVIARWIYRSTDSAPLTGDGQPGRAGIVFDLNLAVRPSASEAGAPLTSAARPYDAEAQGVTGFAFDIDSEPGSELRFRVELASEGIGAVRDETPAYWWGDAQLDASPVHAGHNEFRFDEVGPNPFYANGLLGIGFVVSGNDVQAVNYDFCIDNLTALRSERDASLPPPPADQPLTADDTGWVSRETTGQTRIQGAWSAFSDSDTCRAAQADEACSVILEPDPASLDFAPTPDLGLCTSGVAARVADGSDSADAPDSSATWGAGIRFSLNQDAPDLGAMPYDALSAGVTGFAFDIDSELEPHSGLRVRLVTEETRVAPAWWGGDAADFSPVHAGHNEFRWNEVGGPGYLLDDAAPEEPSRFDPSTLTHLEFLVPSNETHAVSYAFCIKNLRALLD